MVVLQTTALPLGYGTDSRTFSTVGRLRELFRACAEQPAPSARREVAAATVARPAPARVIRARVFVDDRAPRACERGDLRRRSSLLVERRDQLRLVPSGSRGLPAEARAAQ